MSLRRYAISIVFVISVATVASAAQRTFVSAANGADANSCTRNSPCRNFARAIAMTDPGGEVIVLDSGGYGTVTINQSVSLVSPAGVYAGVTAFSGNAITIDSTLANAVVRITGLTLNGLGGENGLDYSGGSGPSETRVYLRDLTVTGFSGKGLNLRRNATYFIHGARVSENWGVGIEISGTGLFGSHASLTSVVVERNLNYGVLIDNAAVTIRESIASNNGGYGFYARGFAATDFPKVSMDRCQSNLNLGGFVVGGAAGVATFKVTNSLATMNFAEGVYASSNGTLRVGTTTSTYNDAGFQQAGTGVLQSLGNNDVISNDVDVAGTVTTYTPK